MWPAATLTDVFQRARSVSSSDQLGERLVSMVLAPPRAKIWKELRWTVGHLDAQTGDAWDLFFIGVPSVDRDQLRHVGSDWASRLDPRAFREVQDQIQFLHSQALGRAKLDQSLAWRPTGGTDLVSLMAYHGRPDWLSLTATRTDGKGQIEAVTLSELSARMRDWQDGPIDGDLSPGLPDLSRLDSKMDLYRALEATAAALGVGVAGNAAYELLKRLFGM